MVELLLPPLRLILSLVLLATGLASLIGHSNTRAAMVAYGVPIRGTGAAALALAFAELACSVWLLPELGALASVPRPVGLVGLSLLAVIVGAFGMAGWRTGGAHDERARFRVLHMPLDRHPRRRVAA